MKTGFYGMELHKDDQGYWISCTNGNQYDFDHKPTWEEIEKIAEYERNNSY